jgi:hypothetical protein
MIPYDDLVAALSAWRARQGLPVSTMGGAPHKPAPEPDDAMSVDDAEMIDEQYADEEGGNYGYGGQHQDEAATAIDSDNKRRW